MKITKYHHKLRSQNCDKLINPPKLGIIIIIHQYPDDFALWQTYMQTVLLHYQYAVNFNSYINALTPNGREQPLSLHYHVEPRPVDHAAEIQQTKQLRSHQLQMVLVLTDLPPLYLAHQFYITGIKCSYYRRYIPVHLRAWNFRLTLY